MPPYFYHLKFELYSTPDPTKERAEQVNKYIWQPTKQANIFDPLPTSPRRGHPNFPRQRQERQTRVHQSHGTHPQDFTPLDSAVQPSVIDCGTPRPAIDKHEHNLVILSERQFRQRTLSFPPPQTDAAIKPRIAVRDWRFGRLSIESVDADGPQQTPRMAGHATANAATFANGGRNLNAVGPSVQGAGRTTKAKYLPLETKNTELGWGIVHLYREGEETPALDELGASQEQDISMDGKDLDCTTLCIPAVPSYLSPSDFLGFIGEKWREEVSHYRMIMTGRMNRYLVLMKFMESKQAQKFRREFDGKVFNDIEPETCHVTFIRSITFETPDRPNGSFPDLSHDPFTPESGSLATTSNSLKPFPPPTPNLIELPTCPVCLERMDDTTGLMTIPCQHVFHCSCLEKWRGSGCPVCRHTNPASASVDGTNTTTPRQQPYDPENPFTQPFGGPISNLCSVCDSPDDLWICLICGNVGCGRYKGGHAKEHWKDTAHSFSLELETQHVWDYAGDIWVHRLIRDKGDGKVVELPAPANNIPGNQSNSGHGGNSHRLQEDMIPRVKLDNIGMEYTHLLTSQLESQRIYFEEMLSKAADKAAKASAAAESAGAQAEQAMRELRSLREEHNVLRKTTIPALEKDLERERNRANKSTDLSRNLSKSLQDEKQVTKGLMQRIEHVNKEMEIMKNRVGALESENADLKDQNHDLSMFISGQEKLKELEAEGKVEEGEIEAGTAGVVEKKRRGKGRR